MKPETYDVAISGGGPAGMFCGFLLARAGLKVAVFEKHLDFNRDFRGDTVHPSTLELFYQLGLLDELLEIPHSRIEKTFVNFAGEDIPVADFSHLPVHAPYIAMMPQWDLLNFIAKQALRYPNFTLHMGSEVVGPLQDESGRYCGFKLSDGQEVTARLTIAADGRHSKFPALAGLPQTDLGSPMDVFWFRVDKSDAAQEESFGIVNERQFMVLIDRREYYQCAYLLPKGSAPEIEARGIAQFRADLTRLAPRMSQSFAQIKDWDQIFLLDVRLNRLEKWHRPGLLVIGDAAHAMSPIAGVGINVAVQDAVAAANILAEPLSDWGDVDTACAQVRKRRIRAVKLTQAMQQRAQNSFIVPLMDGTLSLSPPPLALRALRRFPKLQQITGRAIGLGFGGREAVKPPRVLPE